MGIVIPPSIISHSKDHHQPQQEQLSSKVIISSSLMSQDYHHHHQAAAAGIFSFSSNGFERSEQQHHLTQQIRRDKLRVPYDPTVQQTPATQPPGAGPGSLVGIEEEESGGLPVYESAGMLSEMFNFPPGGPATASELLDQNLQSNYRPSPRQELQQNNEWFNNRQGMVIGGLGPLTDSKNHHHHHQHNQISGINADSAAAMQLFLMNPQPRSPSPATAAPPPTATSNSTLHMLLPNPSTSLHHQGFNTTAGNFGTNTSDHHIQSHHHPQFTWVSDHHDGPNSNISAAAPSASVTQINNPTHDIGSVVEGQGLSLSLSSSLQHLEAAKAEELRMGESGLLYYNPNQTGTGSSSTSAAVAAQAQYLKNLTNQQQQQALHLQGIGVGSHHHSQVHVGYGSSSLGVVNVLRNSKYVKAAQELLEEICSVGRGQFKKNKLTRQNTNPSSNTPGGGGGSSSGGGGGGGSSTSKDLLPLSAADRIEHQRRKVKLLSMLDEVDRRYNHYCEQMQMVVNSFDLVMGFGSAVPYTALAQKAMSRHFRCLKDAIAAQLKHSCELLGEKDGAGTSGLTKGETPRLKILEQSLRQQRAFHQMGMMEQEAWRPQRGLPERSVNILRAWLFEHFLHPYPSDADKHLLARQTGLSRNQVSNWFINARVRLWKPMVEEMYQQESKDDEDDEDKDIPKKQNNNSGQQLAQTSTATPTTTNTTTTPTASSSPTTTTPTSTNRQGFNSENNRTNVTSTTIDIAPPPPPPQLLAAPPPPHGGGHFHQLGDEYGTTDIGSTLIRFGTTGNGGAGGGDVSLTLGLRHAGNVPEKTAAFSVRDFGNC